MDSDKEENVYDKRDLLNINLTNPDCNANFNCLFTLKFNMSIYYNITAVHLMR